MLYSTVRILALIFTGLIDLMLPHCPAYCLLAVLVVVTVYFGQINEHDDDDDDDIHT